MLHLLQMLFQNVFNSKNLGSSGLGNVTKIGAETEFTKKVLSEESISQGPLVPHKLLVYCHEP